MTEILDFPVNICTSLARAARNDPRARKKQAFFI
jgi:hypothetical protein